jgi:N-acyl-D-amino-acid deacylase
MSRVDLRIDNARVVDGSGGPSYMGSVAVVDGRIASVDDERPARRTIDADGAVLAPGFIDLHTHSDFTLPVFPAASAMVRQGVTTQVVGNCGFSPFPNPPERSVEMAEYTSFIDAGIPWDRWSDAAGFAAFLDTLPLGCNVALQVGLGTVRMAVMGFDQRPPRAEELAEMGRHVAGSLDAGVAGVSSGLVYPPGSFAGAEEVVYLASIAGRAGGFYSSHIRNEAGSLVEAVEEALETAARADVPLQLSHHKALGRPSWGLVETTLGLIDSARSAGRDVLADQYPYRAGSTGFTQVLPGWALEGGVDAMRARLRDPDTRSRIVGAIRAPDRSSTREFDPEAILLSQVPDGPNHEYEGSYLSEVAAARGEDPIDCALSLLVDEGAGILMVIFGMSKDDVRRVMMHPAVAIASDGWTLSPAAGGRPHPRSYGTYARVLGTYVRDEGVLSLEEAIHKMTALPARRLPGHRRGLVAPGYAADLVVFDPDTVQDEATYQDPHRFCTGVHHVVVGGELAVEHGEDTEAAAGRVLRRVGA